MSIVYECGLFRCVVDKEKISQQIDLLNNKEVVVKPGVLCVELCPIRNVKPSPCVRIEPEKESL